jgi:hypothetical protein
MFNRIKTYKRSVHDIFLKKPLSGTLYSKKIGKPNNLKVFGSKKNLNLNRIAKIGTGLELSI